MRFLATTIVAAFAVLGAATAQAQSTSTRGPGFDTTGLTGFYVGGSLGGSSYRGDGIGGFDTNRNATGFKLHGGYNITPNFAVEAGYANLGSFHSAAGTVKEDGYFVDGVGKLPVYDRLSVIGRVGVFEGRQHTTLYGNQNGTNYKVGAGLQYDLTPRVGVRGEWERYRFDAFGGKSNTNLYSVGLNYAF